MHALSRDCQRDGRTGWRRMSAAHDTVRGRMEASKPEMQEGHAGSTSHTAVEMQEGAIRCTKTTSQMRLETLAQEKAGELWEILETNVEHSDTNESRKGREGTSQQEGQEEGCEADERLATILQLQLVRDIITSHGPVFQLSALLDKLAGCFDASFRDSVCLGFLSLPSGPVLGLAQSLLL
jgi:hypothetical protein